jgi:hypothetical protein
MATFLLRCKAVCVTLNEVDVTTLDEDTAREAARGLLRTKADWLGEHYDFENRRIAITEKTRRKIKAATEVAKPTWRNIAARISLHRYASTTTGVKLSSYFASLRAYSAMASMLADRPDLWDKPALPPRPHVARCLERWTSDVLTAQARRITERQKPTAALITDASDWGYGGIYIDPLGIVDYVSVPWSAQDQSAWYHEGQRIRRAGRYLQTDSTIRQARSTDGHRRAHRQQHSGLRLEQGLQSVLHRQHHLQQDRTGVPTLGTPHAAHPGREHPGGRPLQRMR